MVYRHCENARAPEHLTSVERIGLDTYQLPQVVTHTTLAIVLLSNSSSLNPQCVLLSRSSYSFSHFWT